MLYLCLTLSLLMSTATILQGASSSTAYIDAAMLARMTAKGSQSLYQATSTSGSIEHSIEQLIAQNSQCQLAQFSPERAVEAQKKLNAQLASGPISPAALYVPIPSTCSELLQCFKEVYVSVPADGEISHKNYKRIMILTPHKDGNKLEIVMLTGPNEPLLEDVTLKTVLGACSMLTGAYPRERLIYSVFGDTKEICQNYRDRGGNLGGGPYASIVCGDLPFYNESDIQGSSFEFTSQTAPTAPVMMAQSLLPTYLEFKHDDMATYISALDEFGNHFAADKPHHVAPVLIPDVKRLQAYLERKDIPATIIVGDKEITDPANVLAATQPVVSSIQPHEWRRGVTQSAMGVVISSSVKLQNYLTNLSGVGFTEE